MKSIKSAGFTLIEIMAALMILAIAISAVLYHLQQNTKALTHLQDKTMAHWVAMNITHGIDVGLIDFVSTENTMSDTTEMLHHRFLWEATRSTSNNPHIEKITVTVREPSSTTVLATLFSYRMKRSVAHAYTQSV